MNTFKIVLWITPVIMVFSVGCSCNSQKKINAEQAASSKNTYDSLRHLAALTADRYKAMNEAELLEKLSEQGKKKKEPFNSLAYRELSGRTNLDINQIVALIDSGKNADDLLPLLLIRKLDSIRYRKISPVTRSAILTDALATSVTFNTWGLPHSYLEDASRAMLECDSFPSAALRKMLYQKKEAPVFGSKEFVEWRRFHYRLCDYALFFLEAIRHNTAFIMPVTPEQRDSIITLIH